jgi:hypothetical protein
VVPAGQPTTHSLTHIPHLYGEVINSTQQDILGYYQVDPSSLTYSLPGQTHLCSDVTNSTWQDILVPSVQPSFTHILTTRSTSPAWLRHQLIQIEFSRTIRSTLPSLTYTLKSISWLGFQLNLTGYSVNIRSTLTHSFAHYQVKLTCVVTSPTQPDRIFSYNQVNPPLTHLHT